jgi:hypothetical protein
VTEGVLISSVLYSENRLGEPAVVWSPGEVAAVDVWPSSEGETGVEAPDMLGVWSSSCFCSVSAVALVSVVSTVGLRGVRGVQDFLCAGQSLF